MVGITLRDQIAALAAINKAMQDTRTEQGMLRLASIPLEEINNEDELCDAGVFANISGQMINGILGLVEPDDLSITVHEVDGILYAGLFGRGCAAYFILCREGMDKLRLDFPKADERGITPGLARFVPREDSVSEDR